MPDSLIRPIGFGRTPYFIAALSVPVMDEGEIDFNQFAEDL